MVWSSVCLAVLSSPLVLIVSPCFTHKSRNMQFFAQAMERSKARPHSVKSTTWQMSFFVGHGRLRSE